MTGETVLICGSREWTDANQIKDLVGSLDDDATVVVGGAVGADQMAEAWARSRGLRVIVHEARWWKEGKAAGFNRNLRMLNERPTRVVAFQVGRSRGTQHTIDKARERGYPVEVVTA